MSNSVISFMLAAGVSAWIYSKLMLQTGGNTKSVLIATAICGVVLFGIVLIILNSLTPN